MFKLIVPACLIMMMTFSQSVRAEDPLAPTASHTCTPTDVTVFFNSRLHIRCSSPMRTGYYGDVNVYYFSVRINDYDNLEHARVLASEAIVTGKRLKVYAQTSPNHNPSGCGSSNCRKLIGISLLR